MSSNLNSRTPHRKRTPPCSVGLAETLFWTLVGLTFGIKNEPVTVPSPSVTREDLIQGCSDTEALVY